MQQNSRCAKLISLEQRVKVHQESNLERVTQKGFPFLGNGEPLTDFGQKNYIIRICEVKNLCAFFSESLESSIVSDTENVCLINICEYRNDQNHILAALIQQYQMELQGKTGNCRSSLEVNKVVCMRVNEDLSARTERMEASCEILWRQNLNDQRYTPEGRDPFN